VAQSRWNRQCAERVCSQQLGGLTLDFGLYWSELFFSWSMADMALCVADKKKTQMRTVSPDRALDLWR
jgi:hypothetical protein